MTILVSPSDNTGWGIGTSRMRATGVRFTRKQPVRVRPYYRAQWGQLNARTTLERLRDRLKMYEKQHRDRLKRKTTVVKRKRRPISPEQRLIKYYANLGRIKAFNRARRAAQ
ncbi:pVII [Bovine adenovirus 7]|uniref:PVII protein n=1 Tax=Bovine adenovirus 7 TaxID=10511 RepID=A0A7R7IZU2_ADEB7|nr:pVII [Bovine adenovirus 7]URN46030.1 pVII [Bovine adenovirus 7]BCO10926.1 pVII [Bovine adenovirus 7]BCS90519.1 pVII [Bovine adenovirus 7]